MRRESTLRVGRRRTDRRTRSRPPGVAVAALAALFLGGCLNVSWERTEKLSRVPPEALEAINPGDPLDACLARLGAPLLLWEYGGDGMALAYGGGEVHEVGLSLSFTISDNVDASFNFDGVDEELEGVVLVFDPDLRLRWVRRGMLRELVRTGRRRPAPIDE